MKKFNTIKTKEKDRYHTDSVLSKFSTIIIKCFYDRSQKKIIFQIKRENNRILCNALVEDCPEIIPIEYSIEDDVFQQVRLPEGYEWCIGHIRYAERFIRELVNNDELPKEKLIMWY